jgi:hypothetical protein
MPTVTQFSSRLLDDKNAMVKISKSEQNFISITAKLR